MARAEAFTIRYRVEATGPAGIRLALAKTLVAIVAVLLKVHIRPTLDDRRATREAEVGPARMIFRGSPVPPSPECLGCGKDVDGLQVYEHRGNGPLCWDCFDAEITASTPPEPALSEEFLVTPAWSRPGRLVGEDGTPKGQV